MPCYSSSDCDPTLDAFLEDTLSPVRRARVVAHLATCATCTDVLAELRVVDALLLSPRQLDPAVNFTFKVMAEARALPQPTVPRSRPFAILATYVIFAWAAIGTFLVFGGASARAALTSLAALAAYTGREFGDLATASNRLFGRHWVDVTAAMGALVALDVVCVGAFVATFAIFQARRRATVGESS